MTCPYCKGAAVLTDSSVIYGKSYGPIWLCQRCRAYVGCHPGTETPLGTLANDALRKARNLAHRAFDPLWKPGPGKRFKRRGEAYRWLAKELQIEKQHCHIGMFDEDRCAQAARICLEARGVLTSA